MACFLVGGAEAIVVTVVAQVLKKSEEKKELAVRSKGGEKSVDALRETQGIPWSRKLMWLAYFLWGGAFLLAYEHVWHGEVVPWFPFLTAMNDPGDTAEMLHEMSTVGVTMAVIVTVVWALLCVAADIIVKRKANSPLENA
jgi:hypothetical protein